MNLFQRPYERALWLGKLHGCFPNAPLFIQPQTINIEEADHIFHLGNVKTSDGKSLGLYEIKVGENTRLARNRVQLRQMVAKQCVTGSLDGALAVYWDEQGKWRLSFISIQYRLNDKGELLKEETASKRYTYLIGEGVQTRTVQTRFNRLPKSPTLEDLTAAFAVEPLNREFYNKLYKWYDDAKQHVVFPNDEGIDNDIHKSNSLIRLLTRLLFVWFIKEKGLANKDLFDLGKLPDIIDWSKPGSYYKAVLQNLFFATLNREINDRSFRTDTKGKPNSTNYLAGNVYRYRNHFLNDKKEDIVSLFKQTPFLNGGLFECLDREANHEEKRKFDARKSLRGERNAIRIDGFSDRTDNGLCVPNSLFFNDEETGLIDLLRQYQFTVEESTPLDVDVALDPELLGKVFENLLADFNPETQASARKASGSYYTPREIVSYMVDESLKTYLTQSLSATEPLIPDVQSSLLLKVQLELERQPEVDNKINTLFRYADSATGGIQDNPFDDAQKKDLIEAIHRIKILDPAVGSGAFPMGILQRLVYLLGVLDPGNELWKNQQLATLPDLADIEADLKTAQQINDKKARQKAEEELNKRIQEIQDNFNNRNHDYSRKLYLIENSIFGIDIQPIAIQICKLRFFISLAIEQNPTSNADDNYGIRALPNLETRFVVADTLLGIRDKVQQGLRDQEIAKKEEELNQIRRRYFNARTLKTKRKCREQDNQLRQEIAELLIHDGWNDTDARKIAAWDPYNQSAPAADWFDTEYMFGVVTGFDVVIGNPPYIESRNNLLSPEMKKAYNKQVISDWGESLPLGSDLLIYFLARTPTFLSDAGYGCLITQNAWLSTNYGKQFQDFILDKFSIWKIVDTSAKFFSSNHGPQINTVITILGTQTNKNISYEIVDEDLKTQTIKTITARQSMKWGHIAAMPQFFMELLSEIRNRTCSRKTITFGQGLNFPLEKLNQVGSTVSVVVKDIQYLVNSTDNRIHESCISTQRKEKIPALIMPRGIGDRHYCTFNVCRAFSFSGVELYLPDNMWYSDLHYCLWVYLNSSLVWLFREVTGRKNLGGGMLKAEATDMKTLPIEFDFNFVDEAKAVFKVLGNRAPLPLSQEIRTDEHLAIDRMVLNYFGELGMEEHIRNCLLDQVDFRTTRSSR